MKLEVLDIEKFVGVNQLRQVTVPSFFEADGGVTAGGVFSAEIFGRPGSEDRRRRWGYIDLGGRYLHPLVYKTCTQLDRKFADVVSGSRRLRLSKTGVPEEVPESEPGGFTGIEGLYDNWEKIDWGKIETGSQRGERVGLLNVVPRDRAFISKWPVMPAIYRDVETTSTSGIREVPPINYLYVRLLTSAPTVVSGLSFADGARKLRAQETLLEIHRASLELIAGKKGLIQDRLLGKFNDYSVRGVLSGPALAKANHPSEQEVPFGTVGIPLYLHINLFQPFVIRALGEVLRPYVEGQERILIPDGKGGLTYFELPADAKASVGPDLFKKWITRFMRSQANRMDPIMLVSRGKEVRVPLYDAILGRQTTLLDLFYIVAERVNRDKYVMFTRYPVEDFRACHFAKASILTTERTERRELRGDVLERYPVLSEPIRWVDSMRINNSYTSAMGADFDGWPGR